ncbi:hypothetical protein [Hydrogenophaga taeniospiralis]|uniref:hypothetical protein n=1 Tax=Hydrogenophaga taeniospiralis TaxID=65656 RepID=UPI001CFB866A|nr:hypothetical protein [Hydrogenophaga taeniospiralis]UCU94261.1 hypothetical protein KI616_26615 [Hydrogenophaga taeniospiralis]
MSGVLRTPDLPRAVADYTGVLGFECRQHIPGVLAVVVHGPLQLQLWACGARPGRWEKPDPRASAWAPTRHSVVVRHIHALHASLRQAILRPVRTGVSGGQPLHAHRLPAEAPALQPWGAWAFAFADIDGQVIHCVDWAVQQPTPDAAFANPRTGRTG